MLGDYLSITMLALARRKHDQWPELSTHGVVNLSMPLVVGLPIRHAPVASPEGGSTRRSATRWRSNTLEPQADVVASRYPGMKALSPPLRAALISIGLALVLLASACSSAASSTALPPANSAAPAAQTTPAAAVSSHSTTTAATIDACKLVTPTEAAAALGQSVQAATHTTTGSNRSDCNYSSTANSGSAVVYVLVTSGARAKTDYDVAKANLHAPQALSGIGEDAFAITLGAPVVQIHFYKDAAYVTVVVTNLNDPQRMEKAKALAARAAARL